MNDLGKQKEMPNKQASARGKRGNPEPGARNTKALTSKNSAVNDGTTPNGTSPTLFYASN